MALTRLAALSSPGTALRYQPCLPTGAGAVLPPAASSSTRWAWAASTRSPPPRRLRRRRQTPSSATGAERWWCWRSAARGKATLSTLWWVALVAGLGWAGRAGGTVGSGPGRGSEQEFQVLRSSAEQDDNQPACCSRQRFADSLPLPTSLQVILLLLAVQGATGTITPSQAELTWRLQVCLAAWAWGAVVRSRPRAANPAAGLIVI